MQATELAATNFTTGNDKGVNPETFNIPVTLSDTSAVLTRGGGILNVITATIPAESTATTIFISFSNGVFYKARSLTSLIRPCGHRYGDRGSLITTFFRPPPQSLDFTTGRG